MDLFEYFDAVDLLRAFGQLNLRFNSLLFDSYRKYRLNFRSIFCEDVSDFYENDFPLIKSRLISLRLSDEDDTLCQSIRLFSDGLTLGEFENLRSFTLTTTSLDERVTEAFFVDLPRLRQLTHLRFVACLFFHRHESNFQGMIDQVWTLPHLTHFHWDCQFNASFWFSLPTGVSTSLQSLTITERHWSSKHLASLFSKTPQLRRLTIEVSNDDDDDLPVSISSPHLSMRKLVLSGVTSESLLTNVLRLVPNLRHLKIETTNSIQFDGDQWKELIGKSLPQLKVFQFKMNLHLPRNANHLKEFDQYFETFRHSFWIERQWVFRGHWGLGTKSTSLYLYSLPYAFDTYPIPNESLQFRSKSTCPDDLSFSYSSIRQISYEPWMFNDPVMSQIQLMNIEQLSVGLPFDARFLTILPTFVKLTSLTINILPTNCQSSIQSILDRSPHLQTLKFSSWTTMTKPPYRLLSPSIRRLDLEGRDQHRRKYSYNAEQCRELSRSPLGQQCQILTIQVEEVICVTLLISMMMTNLWILQVNVKDDDIFAETNLVEIVRELLTSQWSVSRSYDGNLVLRSACPDCD